MYDSMIIGGGPAGLAAAIELSRLGKKVVLIEREARLGGILKQCIHDGFGLKTFGCSLTGPEYAQRFMHHLDETDVTVYLKTFVTDIKRLESEFCAWTVNRQEGVTLIEAKSIILATGCRERTGKQLYISGSRPSGILTAGTAQYLVNMDGLLPCKKCVILGSGDIGLIMARRLTLEGAEVVGIYEVKPEVSGLKRNVYQCVYDFDIPLHLSKTVVSVKGDERLESVVVADVDAQHRIIAGTEEEVPCDGLILSVGLIPENEMAEKIGVILDEKSKGPQVDEQLMTNIPGVFSCGNALRVFDLVDAVTESGVQAARAVNLYLEQKEG